MAEAITLRKKAVGAPDTEQTFYRWKAKFGGMDVPDAKRLRHLEGENARLKKMLAEKVLENDLLQELNRKKW